MEKNRKDEEKKKRWIAENKDLKRDDNRELVIDKRTANERESRDGKERKAEKDEGRK